MASRDQVRGLDDIIVPAAAGNDGKRAKTDAENNLRTERYQLRISGQADITVAGTSVINRGSILGAVGQIGFTDGGRDIVAVDARLARFIAEYMAPSPLPATRLAGFGIQAATLLEEIVPIYLSAYRTGNPNETKYVEANKQAAQRVFIVPRRDIANLSAGPALVGTVTNMTATVEQIADEMTEVAPFLQTFVHEEEKDILAASASLKIDLRTSRYVRGIAIQQDSDAGEVSDIINTLILRGDKRSVIGDKAVTFESLRQAMAYESGGALPPGYLFWDFARYGRLGAMWNPYEDTNLRLELGVSVSAATGGKVRVAIIEYERTASTTTAVPFAI